jgi:hypothetical protein
MRCSTPSLASQDAANAQKSSQLYVKIRPVLSRGVSLLGVFIEDIEINNIFEPGSPSIGDRVLSVRIDLESVTSYLAMKLLGAVEIRAEISKVLGTGIVRYSTITRYLRKESFPDSSEVTEEEHEIGSSDPIDRAILQILNEQPFALLRQLSKRILIPVTTVRYHLVHKIRHKIKHCKWVSRRLSAAQKRA